MRRQILFNGFFRLTSFISTNQVIWRVKKIHDCRDTFDDEARADNQDSSPLEPSQSLLHNWDGEESAEDDGRHSQHLEESSILHEAKPNVSKGSSNNIHQSSLES